MLVFCIAAVNLMCCCWRMGYGSTPPPRCGGLSHIVWGPQSKAEQSKAKTSKAKQSKAKQSKAKTSKAKQ